jgi:integrase
MNTNSKREPIILDVTEVGKLADAIGERWRALVLLSAWCGLRWGEVTELRRSDIGSGCETVSITRGVTRRSGVCTVGSTKSDANRTVVVPPHIRTDVKAHLDSFTGPESDALLLPVRGGCHVNDKVFAASYVKPALKSIGRESVRHHDLRHFAGTMTARVGG